MKDFRFLLNTSIFLAIIVLSILFMFNQTVKFEIEGPGMSSGLDGLYKIPQRQSNYTVLTSSMEVKMSDIPDWISCPPAVKLANKLI